HTARRPSARRARRADPTRRAAPAGFDRRWRAWGEGTKGRRTKGRRNEGKKGRREPHSAFPSSLLPFVPSSLRFSSLRPFVPSPHLFPDQLRGARGVGGGERV